MPDTTVMHAKRFGVLTCSPDATLLSAGVRMTDEDVSALVVVDNDGYLAGIITRADILRAHGDGVDCQVVPVREYMTCDVVTVELTTTMQEVAKILSEHHIHRVVAIRHEEDRVRPVAVVSSADVLYHFIKATKWGRSAE